MSDQETLRYGPHSLQTISVASLPHAPPNGLWVILIHGGAWRDPAQTATNFLTPALSILQSSSSPHATTILPHITAFASINYRLSAHPNHPQDPQTTDPNEFRSSKHPGHIRDVQTALKLLQDTYGLGERYILGGHSCGATLAFQCVIDGLRLPGGGGGGGGGSGDIVHPIAILGTEGIYEMRLLRDTHRHISAYQEFIQDAFGADESVWDAASPAFRGKDGDGSSGVQRGWGSGRLAVLAHSAEDSLVDEGQTKAMKESLVPWESQESRRVIVLPLTGEHDEPWRKGEELVRAIAVTVQTLQEMDLV